MSGHPVPSARARALVAGGYDTHVHVAPDVLERRTDAGRGRGGVRRVVATHREFTSQRLPVAQQRELAEAGALLERCFTTAYTGKVDWQVQVAHIRAVGPAHSVLSSDLGQPFNPPVEYGLALLADRLLAAGFTEDEVHTMAVVNSRHLTATAPQVPA